MPILLFKLNHAPEDEADEVRELLTDHGIAFYETSAGRWGFSMAGIWLRDEQADCYPQARALIDDYQRTRAARVGEEYRQMQEEGRCLTLWQRIVAEPVRYLLVLAFLLFILYVTVMPFMGLGR